MGETLEHMDNADEVRERFDEVVEQLCDPGSYLRVYHRHPHEAPMPSVSALAEIVDRLRSVLFPGYFGKSDVTPGTLRYHVGANLDTIHRLLSEQIMRGHCFICTMDGIRETPDCQDMSRNLTQRFISALPEIREQLAGDVGAAFHGDPAAKTPGEAIFCYPSITALTHHRIAHRLHLLGVPVIPRIINEMAHSKTGIDIHPGATIGDRLFIDHGTGVVIGETCIIGNNVRIYQGVTLGAKSFPKDEHGAPIKGIPRHPIVEDDVIIYSGATILGRVTIGRGSVIGGNVWLTRDVVPGSRLVQSKSEESGFEQGSGI